eukprot:Hpha_TRINITY_DN16461_c2_g7::TRINITY_DN16461_c2_g7_i1::g.159996::m.159996
MSDSNPGCWVCFKEYEAEGTLRPLVLRCGHSACAGCLQGIIAKSHTPDWIECPFCRARNPSGDMPPNFALIEHVGLSGPSYSAPGKDPAPLPSAGPGSGCELAQVAGVVVRRGVPYYGITLGEGRPLVLRRYSELRRANSWIHHPSLDAVFPPKGFFRPSGPAAAERCQRIREWLRRLSVGAASGAWRGHLETLLTPNEGDLEHCRNPRQLMRFAVKNPGRDLRYLVKALEARKGTPVTPAGSPVTLSP